MKFEPSFLPMVIFVGVGFLICAAIYFCNLSGRFRSVRVVRKLSRFRRAIKLFLSLF